jgi:tripeptidyl-peptidase-1
MFRNKEAEEKTVLFLKRSGIIPEEMKITPNGEFIRVTTTIGRLEKLLGCKYYSYTSVDKPSERIFRDLDWSVPKNLRSFIDFVSDTYVLPVPSSIAKQAIHISGEGMKKRGDGNVSPALLHSYYHITQTAVDDARATQSLFESLGQSYAPSDLEAFQKQYNLPQTKVAKVIGQNSPDMCSGNPNNCLEASLDVEFILSIAQNATTWFWSIPGNGDIFVQWVEAVAATSNPPLITSLSYASLAPEDPKFDVDRFNTEMCKLGLKGLTLFSASGDDGVANFQARNDPSECGFTPSFPATSPYATTIGATQGPEVGNKEVVCSSETGGLITSGGGFSTYVKRPDWQDAAVGAYLKNGPNLPPRSKFSSQGRAYPDLAAMGHNYPILVGGNTYVGSGTSASTPVTAGMFSLINGLRMKAGKSPVGWINPTLYSLGGNHSDIFNDITSGENNCCAGQEGSQTCCQYGFTASEGWDPTTGWGSVNWEKLSAYFVSL